MPERVIIGDSTLLCGNVLDILPTLPDESVQCCVTSPPYWGLRSYLKADDPLKPLELGSEKTLQDYIANQVAVFREVRRVLRRDGTLWLNMGDSYATNPHGTGSTHDPKWKGGRDRSEGNQCNRASFRRDRRPREDDPHRGVAGYKPKDLLGVPWRVAFALQEDGWYLRQDIIWHKPGPMPESVTDRCTKAHEYLFLLTKAPKYFYDNEAIKEERLSENRHPLKPRPEKATGPQYRGGNSQWETGLLDNSIRANRRSVWTIASEPCSDAHFAVMPTKLVEPCVLAGSEPGDTVLDPYAGSGTVGVVCERTGRRFVGIELNPAYIEIARRRISEPVEQVELFAPLRETQAELFGDAP